jgi:hypothetical protein
MLMWTQLLYGATVAAQLKATIRALAHFQNQGKTLMKSLIGMHAAVVVTE